MNWRWRERACGPALIGLELEGLGLRGARSLVMNLKQKGENVKYTEGKK